MQEVVGSNPTEGKICFSQFTLFYRVECEKLFRKTNIKLKSIKLIKTKFVSKPWQYKIENKIKYNIINTLLCWKSISKSWDLWHVATALLSSDLADEVAIKMRELLKNKFITAESSKLNKSTQKMLFVCNKQHSSVTKCKTCWVSILAYLQCSVS